MNKLVSLLVAAALLCIALPAMAVPRQITGMLSFEDVEPSNGNVVETRRIRNVKVSILVNGGVVKQANTNVLGVYSAMVDSSQLPVGQPLTIKFNAWNYAAKVKLDLDLYDDWKTWESTILIPPGQGPITLGYLVAKGDLAQHMSIMDAIQVGRDYAVSKQEDTDDISTVEVEYPDAASSKYQSWFEDIVLAGPQIGDYGGNTSDDGWRDGVVLHEFGHHLEWEISDVDDDSIQSHNPCTEVSYDFAWKEGWATYFATTVHTLFPSQVTGSFGDLEPEPVCTPATGPETEGKTEAILFDLFDGVNSTAEPHDRVNGLTVTNAGKPMRDVLFGVFDLEQEEEVYFPPNYYDPPTNILTFHDALVARNPYDGAHADIDRIYAAHGVLPHALSDFSVKDVLPPSAGMIAGKSAPVSINLRNTGGVAYADEKMLVTVAAQYFGGPETAVDIFEVVPFLGDKTFTRNITLPSIFPQGTAYLLVRADPFNRFPESVETNNSRSALVNLYKCGNGTCNGPAETCSNCISDCGLCCGNGTCAVNENCESCPSDCGACEGCGDGFCTSGETAQNCPDDCGIESCFAAGTPITMADGSDKPIEEVTVGDLVLSFDETTGQLVTGEVIDTIIHTGSDRLVMINDELLTTVDHRFWVDGAWLPADQLDAGSSLLAVRHESAAVGAPLSTSASSIRQIEARTGNITTYNFEVARHHVYFAGGFLVHNIKPPQ